MSIERRERDISTLRRLGVEDHIPRDADQRAVSCLPYTKLKILVVGGEPHASGRP